MLESVTTRTKRDHWVLGKYCNTHSRAKYIKSILLVLVLVCSTQSTLVVPPPKKKIVKKKDGGEEGSII